MATKMMEEIFEQRTALENAVKVNGEGCKRVAEKLADKDVLKVVMVARGSSFHACLYFKYLLEIRSGKPVVFCNPSVVTKYGGTYDFANSVVFGVSQSGQGADVNEVIKQAKEQGAFTVAITNHETSPLAALCDEKLLLSVGLERSVAATKTMTAQMTILKTISDYLKCGKNKFDKVQASIEGSLANVDHADPIARFLKDKKEVIVLARGLSLATAHEIALKFQETSYINARPFAISDFYHGPFALADEDMTFVLISTDEITRDDSLEMLDKLHGVGAKVVVISNSDELNGKADYFYPIANSCKCANPIGAVVAGQLIAEKTAFLRGVNPDAPRGLKKVTITQ